MRRHADEWNRRHGAASPCVLVLRGPAASPRHARLTARGVRTTPCSGEHPQRLCCQTTTAGAVAVFGCCGLGRTAASASAGLAYVCMECIHYTLPPPAVGFNAADPSFCSPRARDRAPLRADRNPDSQNQHRRDRAISIPAVQRSSLCRCLGRHRLKSGSQAASVRALLAGGGIIWSGEGSGSGRLSRSGRRAVDRRRAQAHIIRSGAGYYSPPPSSVHAGREGECRNSPGLPSATIVSPSPKPSRPRRRRPLRRPPL